MRVKKKKKVRPKRIVIHKGKKYKIVAELKTKKELREIRHELKHGDAVLFQGRIYVQNNNLPKRRDGSYPKPRRLHERPTKEELKRRVDYTIRQIRNGFYTGKILYLVRRKFKVSMRTARKYHTWAVQELLKELNVPKDRHRARHLAIYTALSDVEHDDKIRVKALERLDKMLGLEQPQKLEIGGFKTESELDETLKAVLIELAQLKKEK